MRPDHRCFLPSMFAICASFSWTGSALGQEQLWEGWGRDGLYGLYLEPMPDMDGDGWPDFMVSEGDANSQRGAVYLYSGRTQRRIQTMVGGSPGDRLSLMAACGDLDGDGVEDFLLGAKFASYVGVQSGRVYQYSGRTFQPLHFWDGEQSSNLYAFVEGTGDLDGDGTSDYFVTAGLWANYSPYYHVGKVYAYSGRTHGELYTLIGQDEYDSMLVRASLGDLDGDHVDDLLATSPGHDSNGTNTGRIYLFSGLSGSLIYFRDGAQLGEQLGIGGAAAGDLDLDGIPDFVVSAPYTAAGGTVYLYSGATGTVLRQWSSDGSTTQFGLGLAAGKDANGDGWPDILIGANYPGPGKTDLPAAFLYCGRTGRLLYRFEGRDTQEVYGTAVAFLDDVTGDGLAEMLIGAPAAVQGQHVGRVELHAGNDLFLQATWRPKGSKVVLQTRGGPPGVPAFLVAQVPQLPGWSRVQTGSLDADGEWRVTLQVPAAFRGLTVNFQSFARSTRAHGDPWIDSALTEVRLQ